MFDRKTRKRLERAGWIIDRPKNHFRLRLGDVHIVFASSTPSCPYAPKKVLANVARCEQDRCNCRNQPGEPAA